MKRIILIVSFGFLLAASIAAQMTIRLTPSVPTTVTFAPGGSNNFDIPPLANDNLRPLKKSG